MGSAVRVILKNPLYTGTVRWNVSQFVRDADSEKYKRRKRPQADWHSYHDATLRIVSDELFAKVELRTRVCANRDERLKSGDPDLTPDELQAVIERAENKRREIEHARNAMGASTQIFSVLPKAAEYYGQ